MQALSARDMLVIWEVGQHEQVVDKALILLALVWPSPSPDALSALTIGQRNACLLALRQKTLGPRAQGFARCPSCREKLEFAIDIQSILPSEYVEPVEPEEHPEPIYTLDVEAYHLRFRLPTCADLAASGQFADLQAGRTFFLERCVIQACKDQQAVTVTDIPEEILQELAGTIIEHDPLAEIEIALQCPACQERWSILFDIVSFFWAELTAQARRLMHDVHALASAYGWRERDILALSSARRKFYRELIR